MSFAGALGRVAVRLGTAATVVAALALGGCETVGSIFGSDETTYRPGQGDAPVELIYNKAMDELQSGDYRAAAPYFEEVERQYPYSVWARRAILMSAYSYYEINKYSDAINACDRFLALYSGNKDAAYAFYLKAISYYEQIVDVGRDQATTQQALVALNDVVTRFPGTRYARDARLKLDLALDHLAGKEMAIGRYYLRKQQYVAAINRFRTVVTNFQTTSQVPEALHRLVEAYVAIGVRSEAQQAAAVLGYNYPGSRWYQESYALMTGTALPPAQGGSWLDDIFEH
ncbi:MAG: outer membrane protein assembly factor BamD [Alphaproteobacteria bacterium]|nr:outer membrane protein assembly factor BamD [Alphaproteobacteria bacterium]